MGKIARHHPGAFQVGVDDIVPILFGVLEERLRHDDPGIVDEIDNGRARLRPLPMAAAMLSFLVTSQASARHCPPFPSISRASSARRSARLAASATLAPGGSQHRGEMPPDPARGTGDERDLPGDVEAR